jgi:N-methylhydantoinase B/oxoprolinase/acetone carboxylase alpha subunit
VLLRQFSLRPDSGGRGLHPGGNGVIRELEFLRPMDVGILSERRVLRPYGLEGGEAGRQGFNWIITRDIKGEDDMTRAQAKVKAEAAGITTAAAAAAPSSGKKGTRGGKKAAAAAASSAMMDDDGAAAAAAAAPVEYVTRGINLGGKNTYKVQAHDRIRIETPGGGGWGAPTDEAEQTAAAGSNAAASLAGSKRRIGDEKGEADGSDDNRGGKRANVTVSPPAAAAGHHFPHHTHLRTHGSVAGWHSAQEQA